MTEKTNKTIKQSKKKISMLEFRAWLQGVEELQPQDWTPNSDQWKLIRKKIDTIDVSVSISDNTNNVIRNRIVNNDNVLPFIPPPPVAGGVPNLPIVGGIPGMSSDGTFKTPNIDTTTGYNNSTFT